MTIRTRFAASAALIICALAVPASASAALTPVAAFGAFGAGAGQMNEPEGIAYAPDGNLYVADTINDRVDVFAPSGAFLFAFGAEVNAGSSPTFPDHCTAATGCRKGQAAGRAGGLKEPSAVAIAPSGTVYVADLGNNRIDAFTASGQAIQAFGDEVNSVDGSDTCAQSCKAGNQGTGTAGQIGEATGIAVGTEEFEGAAYQFLVVADGAYHRIDFYSLGGEFLSANGSSVDPLGNDFCSSQPFGCQPGGSGDAAGEIDRPFGIAFDALSETLSIADAGNNRIAQFGVSSGEFRASGAEVDPGGADVCTTTCRTGDIGGGVASVYGPTELATAAGGDLLVADSGNNRIDEFDSATGAFVRAFGEGVATGAASFEVCTTVCQSGGEDGSVPGAISDPYGVAVDSTGRIAVSESTESSSRIEIFAEVVPTPSTPPSNPPAAPPTTTVPVPPSATPIAPIASAPSNHITLGKLKLNRKAGTANLTVTVPGPGQVVLSGKGIKRVTSSASAAGSVSLPIGATGKVKRELLESGRTKVAATVVFSPTGGAPGEATRRLTLKKTLT